MSEEPTHPIFSIITATFNSAATLEDALESVASQDEKSWELLVQDGGSTDKTLQIAANFGKAKLESKQDTGLYNAMNRGIQRATGQIVAILNSDDFYPNPLVLSRVRKAFEDNPTLDAIYGDLKYVQYNKPQKVVRNWQAGNYQHQAWEKGWMPPHPTFFVKKSVYERFGGFNEELNLAADYEFMLRSCFVEKIKVGYIPHVLVHMRLGGLSNSSIKNRLIANKEDRKAWRINGLSPPIGLAFLKPFRKIKQWL